MTSPVFFRLDDIGPISRKASYLIDVLEELGEPYVLAVIPKALNWWTARQLRQTRHSVIFQHGFNHRNHASQEAPDEFPDSFGLDRIAARLHHGQQLLSETLGRDVRGYVPPYNRISVTALRLLEEQGFTVLSAAARHTTALCEIPIHVDVYTSYRPVIVKPLGTIQSEIDAAKERSSPVGVMLHPLSTPRASLSHLEQCIRQNTGRASALHKATSGIRSK